MTTNFYFTHPIAASFDPRIHVLEEKLHGKGYGLYWYIREKLSYFPRKCCRLEDLKPFATKYYTYRLMQQVVLESGLFEIERGYIIPLRLKCEGETNGEELIFGDTPTKPKRGNKTSRKSCGTESKNSGTEAKSSRTESKNSENPSISDENPMKNDENPSKNSGKQAENGKKRTKNDEKQAIFNEKQAFFDGKQAENSGKRVKKASNKQPERTDKQEFAYNLFETSNTNTSIYIKKEKEKERKIISSTEKEEEEKEGKAEKAVNNRNVPSAPPSLPPVRSWQQYVAHLGTDRQWVEIACMKSGFGVLLMKHFDRAKELFAEHIIAFGRGDRLLTQEDVTSYFISFVTHPVTSKELHNQLLELERRDMSPSDNPYRHEQRLGGRRMYNGRPIPDNAPPRPDGHSLWNDRLKRWEPEYG
ncbi:hypothetical protein [uncultured Bacteroides sp.]|uniref:DUF7833 domain-containing protein n=1 Tax=uncultured Bacteroides sp. TaxID=162156 RepID=UPI0025FC7942|nr:hypothetical protein [uncultured Bacteroides sp.]